MRFVCTTQHFTCMSSPSPAPTTPSPLAGRGPAVYLRCTQGLWGSIMRQAVSTRVRNLSAAHPAANRPPRSPVALPLPHRDALTGGQGHFSQTQRGRSHAALASGSSQLASLSLRSVPPSLCATALAAEPHSAVAERDDPIPVAAPGSGEHADAGQASATQPYVVVNFYHLTDIAEPEQVQNGWVGLRVLP